MIQNYVVVSACEDQDESFIDIVPAQSPEQAAQRVADFRDYAFVTDEVMTTEDFLNLAKSYHEMTVEEAEEWCQEREKAAEESEDYQPDCDYEYPTI